MNETTTNKATQTKQHKYKYKATTPEATDFSFFKEKSAASGGIRTHDPHFHG